MGRLIFSVLLVIFGIAAGYSLNIGSQKGIIRFDMARLCRSLQKAALLFFNPVAFLGATWVADISDVKIAALPFLGMTAILSGGILAWTAARIYKLTRKQTGSFIVCGGFTNIGSLGALFCFILLGEKGFALVPFYKLFEETLYYSIGFPVAKSFSHDSTRNPSFFSRIRSAVSDIFVRAALFSIATGLILNLAEVPRPAVYADINSIFIPIAAFLLLVSIGINMRFSSVKTYIKPGLTITAIKFLILPCLILSLGYLLGLNNTYGGLPFKVAFILSSMPVGFIAMVPPTLYDLDIDLANACWLMTNSLLIINLIIVFFVLRIL